MSTAKKANLKKYSILNFDHARGRYLLETIHWNLNVFNVHPAKGRKNPPNISERLPPLEDGSFLCTCDNLVSKRVSQTSWKEEPPPAARVAEKPDAEGCGAGGWHERKRKENVGERERKDSVRPEAWVEARVESTVGTAGVSADRGKPEPEPGSAGTRTDSTSTVASASASAPIWRKRRVCRKSPRK
ncbi:hypothetical protein DBV15_04139 [Temnothorax longispinosus]|uniref:Uncharacterized protein n=1 Tax=Temnothorax longispinosus TaxID=300112 RepID=A0A4S2KWN5_9HYME|nr:hypothetical protein DBV15_04139 [Temnothorax longispinosus]